ncbi:hypothetical protein M4I32_07495 [Microbacterium sp. LRZ72]|uniref:hypothetical protein n=1 Tax=Microbacterium sp. LRZ72 TaxID=2942481 RepID=UPI0029B6AFC7|nr:hypothetical protein [Microbacterium sp. LRZ72]MDX2376643.1 hypothetical protein [Microbacterium sp. LRZ72]
MSGQDADDRRRSWTILAFASAAFFALFVFGLGMTSLATGEPVIAEEGLSQVPGVAGTILCLGAFATVTASALRHGWAGVGSAFAAGAAAAGGYGLGVAAGAVVAGVDAFRAATIAVAVVLSWVGLVIVAVGVVAGAGAAVAARSDPGVARWPWEKDE